MVPKTFWMGALLVVAFIQSGLQCIVLPNQQIRIEFAGGCQKVSCADERGFPLFTALTELPFCAGQPIISLRRSGSAAGCSLKMNRRRECKPTAVVPLKIEGFLLLFFPPEKAGEWAPGLAMSHFNDIPPWHLWPTVNTIAARQFPYPCYSIVEVSKDPPKEADRKWYVIHKRVTITKATREKEILNPLKIYINYCTQNYCTWFGLIAC